MNDLRFTDRSKRNWPDLPPKNLMLRLADALAYEGCGMDDLWDEISGWLHANNVVVTDQILADPVTTGFCPTGSTSFPTISQTGSAMNLTRLIYTSAHGGIGTSEIDHILQRSRSNNARDVVTGALIISDDTFVQLLEGTRTAIGKCFMRIMQDRRHQDIQVISCGDVGQRLFQEWDMHRIETSQIKQDILARYFLKGKFNPGLMSEFAIEDLCRTLAAGHWQAKAA